MHKLLLLLPLLLLACSAPSIPGVRTSKLEGPVCGDLVAHQILTKTTVLGAWECLTPNARLWFSRRGKGTADGFASFGDNSPTFGYRYQGKLQNGMLVYTLAEPGIEIQAMFEVDNFGHVDAIWFGQRLIGSL